MTENKPTQTMPQFARIRADERQRVPRNLMLLLLIFWAAILCSVLAESAAGGIIGAAAAVLGIPLAENPNAVMSLYLGMTAITVVIVLVCCRCLERRSFRTMGLTRRHLLRDYLCGLLLGTAMFSAVVLLAWGGGALRFEGASAVRHPLTLMLLCLGWMLQGFSEELTFRGWLMMSAGTHHKPRTAILISALCFAAAHLGNDGVSIPACINLTLFGIAMSLLVLRTDSLWAAAALHSAWNWSQGNLFGLQVSGIAAGDSLLQFVQTDAAKWLGGGKFGLEAGIGTTAVLAVLILILRFVPQRQTQKERRHI